MEFFGGPLGRLVSPHSSLRLLLLVTAQILLVSGQSQVGVSLRFHGAAIPNDSFVDIDDIMYTEPSGPLSDLPSNTNPRDEAVLCVTDLEDCCESPRTVNGDWYLPHWIRVGLDTGSGPAFQANRGPNEVINGQRVYGSVRLYRRFTPPERGRFHCELPNAANPFVNQILYVNILNFGFSLHVDHVIISPSTGSTATTAGQRDYSLTCSATLFDPSRLPFSVPSPNFQWSFDGSTSLPSGVTAMPTIMSSSNSTSETYSSTLQFNSPLSQCYIGMYTCRLGAGRLVNSVMVTVDGLSPINISVSVEITTSGAKVLGQSGYSLTCGVTVTGADAVNSSITYQWTKNNGTQTQVGTDRVLSFSPLRLSDAGRYTCQATVNPCDITKIDTQDITLQIPAPTVTLSSNIHNPILPFGSNVILTCAVHVELSPAVDVPVTVNTALTQSFGFPRTSIAQPVIGSSTNYTSTFMISSFERSDSGIYACSATVSLPSNAYVSDSSSAIHSVRVTTGVYLALRGVHITNNSNINIRNIGRSSARSNGALQCVTDNFRCCIGNPGRGEWYQPNGALVQGTTSTTAFYRTRGANGEVFLNRPSGVESPIGQFCCVVPDATSINQILCVNIGGVSISISFGSPIAGESYTLECSAGLYRPRPEGFQWLKGPPDDRTPVVNSGSITINSTFTSSRLQFRPVQQSDNGSYTCSATTNGLTSSSESMMISVNAPPVSVQISDSGAIPTAGESYQLNCSVSGAENLNPITTYRWTRNSGSGQTQVGANSNTLSFTPLRLADAGSYVCEVTISSSYITEDIVAMNVNPQDITIQIPTPSSLMLTSSSEAVMLGSDITLTCTLGLNSATVASDLSLLMIEIQLSRDGVLLNNSTQPSVTDTTFTYTTQLNSFGSSDFGKYTCTATIQPQPTAVYLTGNETLLLLQSNVINIRSRAVLTPPLNVRAAQSGSSAPVEVSWSPPSDATPGYRIFYGNGQSVFVPSVTVITSVSLRVDRSYIGQNVSIRSESDQLYSELVNLFVTMEIDNAVTMVAEYVTADTAMRFRSCTTEIGITVGAVIVVVCLVAIVITVIVVLCLKRRKTSESAKDNANMAYGEVNLKPMEAEGEYENPETIILKPSGQGDIKATATTNTYEAVGGSNPAAPDYATMEEAVCVNQHST